MKVERQNKFYFLDVEVIREQFKFKTTIYDKSTFSAVCSNFESFLPSVYNNINVFIYPLYLFFHLVFFFSTPSLYLTVGHSKSKVSLPVNFTCYAVVHILTN